MAIVIAAVVAALVAALGPEVLRRLPEPVDPDDDKPRYSVLADVRYLRAGLALSAALMAGVVAWRVDDPALLPVWVAIAGVGAWLGFIDWHTRLLPYAIVAPLYVTVLALVALSALVRHDRDVLVNALIANAVVYVLFRLFHWAGARFMGGAFGYGDVRLAGVVALALGTLGTREVLVGVYAAFLLGAVLGVVLSRLKIVDANGYAFGPYIVIGAVLGAAWGPLLYAT